MYHTIYQTTTRGHTILKDFSTKEVVWRAYICEKRTLYQEKFVSQYTDIKDSFKPFVFCHELLTSLIMSCTFRSW